MTRGVAWMIMSRLWHNRRLAAATVLGFVLAVGIVCSIPIYADGSLQRILTTELGKDEAPGRMPAALEYSYFGQEGKGAPVTPAQYDALHGFMTGAGPRRFPFTPDPFLHVASLDVTFAEPVDRTRLEPKPRWLKVGAVLDLDRMATVKDGRLYRPGLADGFVEAVVTDAMALEHELTVGAELSVPVARGDQFAPRVKVRVVGVIANPKPGEPHYLVSGPFDGMLITDLATFRQHVLEIPGSVPFQLTYFYGLSAAAVKLSNLNAYLDSMFAMEARAAQLVPGMSLFSSPRTPMFMFARKADVLRRMLLVLSAPLLALVGYYILVTATLTVDRQRGEIAVLRSRGAGLAQLLAIYAVEGALFGSLALVLGPWLGLWIAKAMGAAAGFVQFVDRKPLPVGLTPTVYEYGAAAAVAALAATLVPAFLAARESIVSFKQQQARAGRPALWHRFFLDLLLIGLSGYGWYTLNQQAAARANAAPAAGAAAGVQMVVEPLHFLLPALLIAGLGLLLLRVLPLLVSGLERLTRRWAGAPLHLALTQVARSPSASAPVVLLLTLTVGLGLYSAAAARTLEAGYADRIYYSNGADVSLWEVWESDDETRTFFEPPWSFHRELPGVISAARVLVEDQIVVRVGGRRVSSTGRLMAIEGPEFAETAWFRRDLAPNHLNDYINLLTREPEAVLVSPGFMQRHRLQPGDRIALARGDREANLIVFGTVPHFPGLPVKPDEYFVANLDFIFSELGARPYRTWLKMAEGASIRPVVAAVQNQGIPVLRASDARAEVAAARRDPQRTGVYGALTIGFIVSAGLTVLGFLLHAVLSLRSRHLQLGVLRAMGLSVRQLLGALALEQVYTVGAGMAAGTLFGLVAARLYLPLLKLSSDLADSTLPFRIVSDPVDRVRLYTVLALMLLLGFFSLGLALRSLQIHQAVKLGEDG